MAHASTLGIDDLRLAPANGDFRAAKYRTRGDRLIGSAYLVIAVGCVVFLALVGVMSLATA